MTHCGHMCSPVGPVSGVWVVGTRAGDFSVVTWQHYGQRESQFSRAHYTSSELIKYKSQDWPQAIETEWTQARPLDCVRSKQGSLRLCLLYYKALFVGRIVILSLNCIHFKALRHIFMMHAMIHDAMQRMQTWGDEFIKCQGELMSDVRSGESWSAPVQCQEWETAAAEGRHWG